MQHSSTVECNTIDKMQHCIVRLEFKIYFQFYQFSQLFEFAIFREREAVALAASP